MAGKLGNLGSELDGSASKMGGAHPGNGAFGIVGEAFGGKIGTSLTTASGHITGVAGGARRAQQLLRATVGDLRENESNTASSFDRIKYHGKGVTFGKQYDEHGHASDIHGSSGVHRPPQVNNSGGDTSYSGQTAGDNKHVHSPPQPNSHPLSASSYDPHELASKVQNWVKDPHNPAHQEALDKFNFNDPAVIKASKLNAEQVKALQKQIKKEKLSTTQYAPTMGGSAQFGNEAWPHSSMKPNYPNHHPLVGDVLNSMPPDQRPGNHGYCAETGSISDYLYKHDKDGTWSLEDARKHFDNVGGATVAHKNASGFPEVEPCASCDYLTQKLGIHGVGSGNTNYPWNPA